ncbi:exonuclease SbcCD subunit D [Actinomadura sp. 3N508]|uniref:exonuclease SbcCD subunit D n=1 Tax=Actinomadura sp. 3N508 TaxID=3375153 RepID=UPI0037AF7C51
MASSPDAPSKARGAPSEVRRPATILHTSDCHLDRVDGGSAQRAFAAMVDAAIDLDVDLVLIAGDLFDHARIGDDVLDWTARRLADVGRPVVLLPGNHDVLDAGSVYHRFDLRARCPNLLFLGAPEGRAVEVPGTDVIVWGRAMTEHAPTFRPLLSPPPRVDGRWLILAGHGLAVPSAAAGSGRSSPILPEDLDDLDADYVALGYLHVHEIIRTRPLTAYSGATARSRGGMPGYVLVHLVPGRPAGLEWQALHT